jgi:hypothetical protein
MLDFCTHVSGLSVVWNSNLTTPMILKNCYVYSALNQCYQATGITLITCASSDTSGSIGLQNIACNSNTFKNVTSNNEDLRPPYGSSLINVGTTTSGEPSPMNFTTDIKGNSRTGTWDIGAHGVMWNHYINGVFNPSGISGRTEFNQIIGV